MRIALASSRCPVSRVSAASTRSGEAVDPEQSQRRLAHDIVGPDVEQRGGAGEREIAVAAREFVEAVAVAAGQIGRSTAAIISSDWSAVVMNPVVEIAIPDLTHAAHARHVDRRIVGGADRGQLGGRIGVREAAADGAAVACLPMSDMPERLAHQGAMFGDVGGEFEVALARHGAYAQMAVGDRDTAQLLESAEIDEMIGDHVAEVHHRHERLAAGQNLGVRQLGQQLGGLLELPRRVIIEGSRFHCSGRDLVRRQARSRPVAAQWQRKPLRPWPLGRVQGASGREPTRS